MQKETPVVFKSCGQQIMGVLHTPGGRRSDVPAVLMLHGFTGTKVESHRLFVKMARTLAGIGIASLRFDFRGSGDSGGEFSKMTLAGEIRDAWTALRFLRRQEGIDPARIGILGMSMGAVSAAPLLGGDKDLRAGVLWGAVADPGRLVQAGITPEARKQLRQLGCADYGGFAVGREFIADARKHDPLRDIAGSEARVLVIHGGQDETVPVESAAAFEAALKRARRAVVKHIVPGAGHTFASLAWEVEVLGITMEWYGSLLLGPSRALR